MKEAIKHIVIICSRLDEPGGIERAICNTANLFNADGAKVTLLIIDTAEGSFYPLEGDIKILYAKLHFGITPKGNVLTRKFALYKNVQQLKKILVTANADIIISTDYVFSVCIQLARKQLRAKVYSWEHHHFSSLKKSAFWNFLCKKLYPGLDAVVCLNKLEEIYYKSLGCKTVVIPNFITRGEKAPLSKNNLLTIGWLSTTKGVDFIPAIAAIVFKEFRDWKWNIIGTGAELENIENEIDKRRLNQYITIQKPVTFDLSELYKNSSIYVMTSRFECFPMVLLEAMSYGVPCITFDCPTGPGEIIRNEVDGLLVKKEDITAMAEAIMQLMRDEEKRARMGAAAHKNIERFSPVNIAALWQKLFEQDKLQIKTGN